MSSAITISAVGTGLSYMNGQQANKNASRAMSAQQAQQQADLDFRQQQYNRYLGLMGPLEEQQAREAKSSQPLDYDQNAAAIKQNYGNAMRNQTGAMAMRGMAGSGLDLGGMRGAALGQASALSGAYNQGLINRRNLGLSLTGRGQIQQSAGAMEGGFQNMSNLYGNQANLYNGAAQSAGQSFGQGLGNLGSAIQGWYNQPVKQTGANGWGMGSGDPSAGTSNPSNGFIADNPNYF